MKTTKRGEFILDALSTKTRPVASGCHEWKGLHDKDGYALIYLPRAVVRSGPLLTHRLGREMWKCFRGPIPTGYYICHSCDNPRCVNIDHLFCGSPKENQRDRINKGRSGPCGLAGESNGRARLTWKNVANIRRMAKLGITRESIASHYRVTPSLISQITTGRIWKFKNQARKLLEYKR